MKKVMQALGLMVAGALLLAGGLMFWQSRTATPKAPVVVSDVPPVKVEAPALQRPIRLHNYDVQEGTEYGYTAEISQQQREAGQAANNVLMFTYAGQRDGRHQIHSQKGNVLFAFECSAPCEVIKALTAIDVDGLRKEASVERLRAAPGMVAALALEDAMNGRLKEYEQYQNGRRYEVWVDERKGITQ